MDDASQVQNEAEYAKLLAQEVRIRTLTVEQVELLDRALRPKGEEIAAMLEAIRLRKKWTRNFLCAILSIHDKDMTFYERGTLIPPGPTCRLIWLFYMMDEAPEKAFSLLHMATWGKIEPRMPEVRRKMTPEEREKIIEELRLCASSRYLGPPGKMGIYHLARHYGVSYTRMLTYCKAAEYKPTDGRLKTYRKPKLPFYLTPHSIWLHVDWSQSNKAIAEKLQCSIFQVNSTRNKLRKLPKAPFKRHLIACGVDLKKFYRILVWKRVKKQEKPILHFEI